MTSNSNDYPLDKEYRAGLLRKAQQDQMAHIASSNQQQSFRSRIPALPHAGRRVMITATLIILLALVAFGAPQSVGAQAIAETIDDGGGDAFGPSMLAYRLAEFYFVTEDYEQAAEKYAEAIELMPVEVFQQSTDYAVLYRALAESQIQLGDNAAALDTYHSYLEISGENAGPALVAHMQELENSILTNATEGTS
jgi:tetratricopeptide (TPR) repeat protein